MDLLYRVKAFFTALRGSRYTWPVIDTSLPGNRHFHLIGGIHMGSRDMTPPPAKLFKKPNRADALIVEVDASGDGVPFANFPASVALEECISLEQLGNLRKVTDELGILPSLLFTRPL